MPKFNYNSHKNINLSLQEQHIDSEEKITDKLLEKDHVENKEKLNEELLSESKREMVERLTEHQLEGDTKQRNSKTFDGDIPKLEEQRLAKKDCNEKAKTEKVEVKKGKKDWWNKKSEDGLKIASKKVVAQNVGEWSFYIQPITNILSANVAISEETTIEDAVIMANEWLRSQNYNVTISPENIDELSFEQNILKFLVKIPEPTIASVKKK